MSSQRIASVDILRGLTIVAMILVNTPGTWADVYAPLLHADWHGLTPTDLIFPFFLFIVGISIHFAYKNKPTNSTTYRKIIIRGLKLIGLGLFLGAFLPYMPFVKEFGSIRFPGVLQRIGLVFLVSAILYKNVNWKVLFGIFVFILVGYWILLGFIPLPNGSAPTFERAPNNWAMFVDSNLLGNHMWKIDYDPEGLMSSFPAIATCLSGILIGRVLDRGNALGKLIILGISMTALGYLWNVWFPLNKALWTSSFVLATSGWGTLILALIYYITDVKKLNFGTIFKYVGMNAIMIYFASSFITKCFYLLKFNESQTIHGWLYQTIFVHDFMAGKLSSMLYGLSVVMFYLLLGYIMHRKKIFIKV